MSQDEKDLLKESRAILKWDAAGHPVKDKWDEVDLLCTIRDLAALCRKQARDLESWEAGPRDAIDAG